MRAATLAVIALLAPQAALAQTQPQPKAQTCPQPVASARKLVLVTGEFTKAGASIQRFQRAAPGAPWQADGAPVSGVIGYNGLAWSAAFSALAAQGEPMKAEGDKRSPAGFYKIGANFGFAGANRANYVRIVEGTTCVNDLASPAYNTITTREKVGWGVHGENMWRVPEYRRGLFIEYPSDRHMRAGSCIFIHLQLSGKTGTAGCVALSEPELDALQEFAADGAVLAIVPRSALERFKGCLPEPAS
jgi:L,D-peptidoglycan transpeptidase YkuD (ErfK/YbiS/YcfS/YnhG family)